MRATLAALLLGAAACATAPQPLPAADDPRTAAARFLDAIEEARWDDGYALLSDRWRARLTPQRLAADRQQGGALAADRLERARLALRQEAVRRDGEAHFAIGEGHGLRLVREAGGWRIDALE